jgi:D-xylose transport system substrate-binding protein
MEVKVVSRRSATLLAGVAAAAVAVAIVASGATARSTQTGSVCVLLPDTKSSVRWEQFDRPAFVNAFKKAGVPATVVNALNDPQKQLSQAEQCISSGSKVGIITSLDTGTSIAIQKKFTAAGGKTIDYDRLVVGGTSSVYVTFDGNLVGRQQALGVIAGMKAKGTYKRTGVLAQLWGGPTDANAFWFKSGNDDILNPVFRAKKVTKGPAKFVPEWDAKNAQTIFEQMLVQTNNRIDGAVAANDNIAGAVVATLKAKGLKPIALSGQDATVQGVQNIISGWQTNTVYKYVPDEANAAAAAAIALYNGKKFKTNATRPNGKKKMPTFVIPVVSITKANYTRLFRDRFLKRSEVCSGEFKKYCK